MPQTITLTPGYTFTEGEEITEDKLNSLGNPAVSLEGTIGTASIADASITSSKLATGAVTAPAIAADAVTQSAMAPGAVCAATAQPDAYFFGAATVSGSSAPFAIAFNANGVNTDPVPSAYAQGQCYCFLPNFNCPGACTVNINGIGTAPLKKYGSVAMGAGDFLSGQLVWIQFDGTNFQIDNAPATVGGSNQGLVITPTSGQTQEVSFSAAQLILSNATGGTYLLTSVNVAGVSLAAAGAGGLDTGSVAANTWYYIWCIFNGTTVAGLLSLSATAPTLPTGYFAMLRLGACVTDKNSHVLPFSQLDRKVWLPPCLLFTAQAATTANTRQSLGSTTLNATLVAALAANIEAMTAGTSTAATLFALYVPPIALSVSGAAGTSVSTAAAGMAVSADSAGTGEQYICAAAGPATRIQGANILSSATVDFYASAPFDVPLTVAQSLYWQFASTSAYAQIVITGYTI